jgi:uncharacterized membrane protein YoaK (UPF0700 family)
MRIQGEVGKGRNNTGSRVMPIMGREGMLLLLTLAAGSMDAMSYLGLGHVFTAMMTGNTVLLGLALGQGHILAALRSIIALVGFAAGVAAGALVVQRDQPQGDWPPAVTRALALEGLLLGAFALMWHLADVERGAATVYALILVSGLAMGIQSAAAHRLGVPGMMTTYITGTLTSLVVGCVSWLRSVDAPPSSHRGGEGAGTPRTSVVSWERRIRLLSAVFLLYGCGALVGGFLQARSSSSVTLIPLLAVVLVTVNATVRQRLPSSTTT